MNTELMSLVRKINADPVHIMNEKDCVFQIILEENESFQITLSKGHIEVLKESREEPQVTIRLSEKNFSKLLTNNLNTTMAFMTGQIKVDGKIGLALKLQEIIEKYQ